MKQTLKLDEEKLRILQDFERGEFKSIKNFREENRKVEEAAHNTLWKETFSRQSKKQGCVKGHINFFIVYSNQKVKGCPEIHGPYIKVSPKCRGRTHSSCDVVNLHDVMVMKKVFQDGVDDCIVCKHAKNLFCALSDDKNFLCAGVPSVLFNERRGSFGGAGGGTDRTCRRHTNQGE